MHGSEGEVGIEMLLSTLTSYFGVLHQDFLEATQCTDRDFEVRPQGLAGDELLEIDLAVAVDICFCDSCFDLSVADAGVETANDLDELLNGQLATVVGVDQIEYLPQVGSNIQVFATSHPFDEGIPRDNSCSIDRCVRAAWPDRSGRCLCQALPGLL